ncbi:alpha/beta-hydrolase [Eremomyces bilateralis CBS 781.70]|uniref:Alpha/beta-hydrolase n=1 Tax=Eremomyces bilateralis CBS 781.70 TaxID=1392243 RepID=A0A6G1FQV4_9PEZI|nr:alpha/beta-hydrolase [Eremomyces bilateralis CBS 781.70]KAF1808071.1 alpha/beta-hydrolase [Eremomyces bilateralis CBS 781.70]
MTKNFPRVVEMVKPAKLVERRTHFIPGKLRVTEHFFEVPRDHASPERGTLRLFARSVRKATRPIDPSDEKHERLPWMLYLQGGPGFGCAAPQLTPWTETVLDKGYELLHLDARGVGLSSPLSASVLGLRGDEEVQTNYLKSFGAVDIVRDCEAIRLALMDGYPPDNQKWSLMGQSFGGFCTVTYLSMFPSSLRECFLLGGLPPIGKHPDVVYERLYNRVLTRNEKYYAKYPEDVDRVKQVTSHLVRFGNNTVRLPSGGSLTARRFLQLGINFGGTGGFDVVHDLVLRATGDLSNFGHLTRPTLSSIESQQAWDDNIIYAILHESIYCEGVASNWSAQRIRDRRAEFNLDKDGPLYFTGEMIYPWMLEDYAELRKLSGPANALAKFPGWGTLYSPDQLAKNEVPVYAAVYMDDMYVDFDLARETSSMIRGCKVFITNTMYHDALRSKTADVLKALFALREDEMD